MTITSTFLVGLMLMDLMQASLPPVMREDQIHSSVSGSGTLTVSIDADSTIGSVPKGAERVPFLTLNFSASCDSDIALQSIELKHAGLGKPEDIASVYAVEGYTRTTRAATFDRRSGRTTLYFRSKKIPKCSAATVSIYTSIRPDATVGSEHAIVLESASAIHSSAKQTVLSQYDPTKIVIPGSPEQGSITARMLPVSGRPRFGFVETVARIQLTADSKHGHVLKSIRFTNEEDARDMDLQWLRLELLSGSVLTSKTPRMKGYNAILQFSPTFILRAGSTVVLNLKAEVRAGVRKKIRFIIEEPADIVASPYRER